MKARSSFIKAGQRDERLCLFHDRDGRGFAVGTPARTNRRFPDQWDYRPDFRLLLPPGRSGSWTTESGSENRPGRGDASKRKALAGAAGWLRFWAHVVITALRDKNGGGLSGFSQVIHDVTERRQARQTPAAKARRPTAIWLSSARLGDACAQKQAHNFCERRGARIAGGGPSGRLIGRRADDFIPAADGEIFCQPPPFPRGSRDGRDRGIQPGRFIHGPSFSFTEGTLVRLDDSCVAVEIATRRINFQEPAIQLVAHNLTGQKNRRPPFCGAALRRSEEQLRLQNTECERRGQEHMERNGSKATENLNLQEEATKRGSSKRSLDREQSLQAGSRRQLNIREELIEQSEAMCSKR